MAPQAAGLNTIARAEATPAQAREALLAVFGQPSVELLQDAYLALRAWVWKALDQRRRDPELREWDDLICAAASLMAQRDHSALAERLTALHELLAESIAVGEALAAHDVTRRQHVAEVLDFLVNHDGQANRAAIGAQLSLGQANLTRVLNLLMAAGLIERTTLGKEAVFSLSRTGVEVQRTRLGRLRSGGALLRAARA
jgi:DNA-binding MarR family transcriptional regulator